MNRPRRLCRSGRVWLACSALSIVAHAGSSICRLKDVNGDGIDDLALASRDASSDERVWLLSGKDGAVLRTWRREPAQGFGIAIATLSNGDRSTGHELAVLVASRGASHAEAGDQSVERSTPVGHAQVVLFSFETGERLRTIELSSRFSTGAVSMAAVDDWDGDHVADIATGLPSWSHPTENRVSVLSSGHGRSLFDHASELLEPQHNDQLGASIVCPGDLDGDGRKDLIVGAPYRRRSDGMLRPPPAELPEVIPPGARGRDPINVLPEDEVGCVLLVSGKTGERLACAWGDRPDDEFGRTIAVLGDTDGDGLIEIAVAATNRYVRLLAYDPQAHEFRTLQTFRSHGGYGYMDSFGSSLDTIGDVDGDGRTDVLVGADEQEPPELFDEGYAEVWSGATGKRISMLFTSRNEGVEVCGLSDVDGKDGPDVALSIVARKPKNAVTQRVRVVSARDGKKIVWERSVAELRTAAPPK